MTFDPDRLFPEPPAVPTLFETPLAFLDVETTGASTAAGERITEIAIVRVEKGVVTVFDQLLCVNRRINPFVVQLTGITPAMLRDQPAFADVLPQVRTMLEDAVVVGHNVLFDLGFLAAELRRAGVTLDELLGRRWILDTLRLARKTLGGRGHGLQRLAKRFAVEPRIAHRALADVETTRAVFEKLIEPLGGWRTPLREVVAAQGGTVRFNAETVGVASVECTLRESIESRCDCTLIYLGSRRQKLNHSVRPIELERTSTGLVLVAHCHERNNRRHFRLNRIVAATAAKAGGSTGSIGQANLGA